MGILKAVFSLFIFSFFLSEIARLQFSNGVAITLNDILLILLILVWLIYLFLKKKKPERGSLGKSIIFFAGAGLFSLLVNSTGLKLQEFEVSFLYLLRWVFY